MADNVAITEGSGKNIATDDVQVDGAHTQGQVQFMKLVDGTLNGTASVRVDIGAKANALRIVPANDITDATYIGDIKFGESLPAGTNTIGKLASNSGVDIGDVTLNAGIAEIGKLATGVAEIGNVKNSGTFAVQSTLQTGSNAIGKLAANNGVDIGDVDVTSIIPLTGATNLGKARDTALGATDTGVMALAVRDDTLTTLTPADGDYVPLRVSSTGQLHVTGGGGGTQYNIDTVLGGAATTTLAGVVRNDSLTTLTEADGDISVLRVSSTGQLYVTGGGGGVEYTEDVVTANPQIGSAIMMERDDALTTVTPVEADWIGLRGTAEGALWVQDFNSDAILADTANMDTNLGTIAGAVAAGQMQVDVVAPLPAGTNNIGDVDVLTVPAPLNLTGGGVEASALRVTIANDSTGVLSIDDNDGSITVDGAVIANAGTNLNTSALALEGGGNLATIAGNTTAIQVAVEIMDDWDATHDGAASSDGPQLMGAYDSTKPTAVGDGDAVRVLADAYGRLLSGVEPEWFNAVFDSANATAEGQVIKAASAGRKIYIMSYVISSDIEGWIKLQDEDSNALTGKMWLKAGGGIAIVLPPGAPLVLDVVNKALEVICEASGDVSVTITGYLAV